MPQSSSIELELPNDLLVQCAFLVSWHAWIFLYPESSLVCVLIQLGKWDAFIFCIGENVFLFCRFFKLN